MRTHRERPWLLAAVCLTTAAACTIVPADTPVEAYWSRLEALCGQSYAGEVEEAPAGDTTFAGKALVMHVQECSDSVIRIPFRVGEDRSRTWILSRTATGVRLKHDHRHADGTLDSITDYGGDARMPIGPTRAEFPADSYTSSLIPAASTNVWTVAVTDSTFVYALRREGTDRRFRIVFALRGE